MRLALPSVLAVSLLVVACGAPDAGDESATNRGAIAFADSCEALAGAYCDGFVRCGVVAPEHRDACAAGSLDCGHFVLDRQVEAGALAYDGAALRRCLAALAEAPCEANGWAATFLEDEDCRAAFRGTVPVGGECDDGLVCASGACDYECPGRCLSTGEAGAACGPGLDPCAPHLGCVNGACGPLPGAGQPCATFAEGGEVYYGRCAAGLACDGTGHCREAAGEGDPCTVDDEYEYAGPAGECGLAFRCVEGRCVARGDVGDACEWSEDCRVALQCLDGSCVPKANEGEPCEWDGYGEGACALGLTCLSSGVCGRPLDAGAPCVDHTDECRDWCEQGVCAIEVAPGEACDDATRFCWSGPCVDGVCTLDCSDW